METNEENADPIHDIVDYLIRREDVRFKSQQIGEIELATKEKKAIALEVYKKGNLCFLRRFGKNLKLEHLLHFEKLKDENSSESYEMNYHIESLKVSLSERGKKHIAKNRRYEALSQMIKKGTYFSEVEMMERNPLLYEQLVGQYMTENEKKTRDNIDTENITLLNVLLEGISKNQRKCTLEKQKETEDGQKSDYSEAESEDDEEMINNKTWGEFDNFKKDPPPKRQTKRCPKPEQVSFITAPERALLKEEFIQEMYRSFVDGEDENFDYASVDCNSEFDCVDVRGRDEEEKYFDTESSDGIQNNENQNVPSKTIDDNESEDELDVFMNHLSEHPSVKNAVQIHDN